MEIQETNINVEGPPTGKDAVAQMLARVRQTLGKQADASFANENDILAHKSNRDLLFSDLNKSYDKIGRPRLSRRDFDMAVVGKPEAEEVVVEQQQPQPRSLTDITREQVVTPMATETQPQTGEFGIEEINGKTYPVAPGTTLGGNVVQPSVVEEKTVQPVGVLPAKKTSLVQTLRNLVTGTPKEKQEMAYQAAQDQKDADRSFAQKWGVYGDLDKTILSGASQIAESTWQGIKDYLKGGELHAMLEWEKQRGLPQNKGKDAFQLAKIVEENRNKELYNASKALSEKFQKEVENNNISTDAWDNITKGNWDRVPESVAYTVANVGMQILPSLFTYGTSTYFQTLPQVYEAGVNARAKELGITPEEVIKSGQDGKAASEVVSLAQAALERTGAGLVSNAIAKKGGYNAVRDWVIKKLGNSAWSKAAGSTAGLGFVTAGEGLTGGLQEVSSVLHEGQMADKGLLESFEGQGKRILNAAGNEAIGGFGGAALGRAFVGSVDNEVFGPEGEPPSQPPASLGGIPTQPVPPTAPQFTPETPTTKPTTETETEYVTVTDDELTAFRQGQVDEVRMAGIQEDADAVRNGELSLDAIDDPNYRTMVELTLQGKNATTATQQNEEVNATSESQKSDIENRVKETENKIKNKNLFLAEVDENGNRVIDKQTGRPSQSVGEIISQSDDAPVPTSVREINGIEFVEFSNPRTGDVDVIVTGKNDGSYVGYYRLYNNGKPTNQWSSKFENPSRNKEDFKTMISGVQSMLPEGHEYTEKTSISTDGLRVWNQQLNRGYQLQYDGNGNIVTNKVAINGDAIVNELGIDVDKGSFENISVRNNADIKKVKQALLPYLQKLGLNESNLHFENGTAYIDLPVLKKPTTSYIGNQANETQPTRPSAEVLGETAEVAPETGGGVGTNIPEAQKQGPDEVLTDAQIEGRMTEIEGDKNSQSEFNALEKEMEKRERALVFDVSLNRVSESVDIILQKDKDKPNGFGSFIDKKDARETKQVAERYLNADKLTEDELMKDFSDAVRGNPTTWYADGLKLREALNEATRRGIDTEKILSYVVSVYTKAGYSEAEAKSVVGNMLAPIFNKNETPPLSSPEPVAADGLNNQAEGQGGQPVVDESGGPVVESEPVPTEEVAPAAAEVVEETQPTAVNAPDVTVEEATKEVEGVEVFHLIENEGKWKATTKTYRGREIGNWVYSRLDKKQTNEYEKLRDAADNYGTKKQAEEALKKLKDFELKHKEAFAQAKQAIDNLKQEEERQSEENKKQQKIYDQTAQELDGLSDKDFEKLVGLIDEERRQILEQRFGDRIERRTLFRIPISESYHKAKADGSNPELVKAVEELLGKEPSPFQTLDDILVSGDIPARNAFKEKVGKERFNEMVRLRRDVEKIAEKMGAKIECP